MFNNRWFIILLLMSYFKPAVITKVPSLNEVIDIMRIIFSIAILFAYIGKRKYSKFILMLLAFQGTIVISTIFNNGNIKSAIIIMITIVTLCMFIELCLYNSVKEFFIAVWYLFATLIVIELVLMFLYPNGLIDVGVFQQRYHLLGHRNQMVQILAPLVAIFLVKSIVYYEKITNITIIMITCILLSLYLCGSSTALVGVILIVIYFLLFYKGIFKKIITFNKVIVVYTITYILIVIVQAQEKFKFFIEVVLNKSLTMSSRTFIWNNAIELVKQCKTPLWGYGMGNISIPVWGDVYSHPHNQILNIILEGGYIAIILFILILFICGKQLNKFRQNDSAKIFVYFIFVILVVMLTEYYGSSLMFFMLLTMAYHIKLIVLQTSKRNINKKCSKYMRRVI